MGGQAHRTARALRPGQGHRGRARRPARTAPSPTTRWRSWRRRVEDALRAETTEPTSQQVGVAVLERLKSLDDVAYLRFASVYKGFEDAGDFQREVGLLTKTTEPKRK